MKDKTIYIDKVYIFTNRNCLIFDNHGEQMVEYQKKMNCLTLDKETARFVLDNAQEIRLARWSIKESFEITADEAKCLLGIHEEQEDDHNRNRG